ncbi:MAG: hypothetical protein JOY55_25145 [Mycobacterium sp.]|nr:hypothetical protein [Mycobacterium sp.]
MSLSRTLALFTAGAGAVVVSACGSSGGTTPPRPAGEVSKTADQIVADAQAALSAATSVHLSMTGQTKDGTQSFQLEITQAGVKGTLDDAGVTANVIVVGGRSYLQGQGFFAKYAGPVAASVIGNRWVQMPSGTDLGLSGLADPRTLAICMVAGHGTLSKGTTSSFDGTPAIGVLDKGNAPGDAPGTMEVATTGPAYPLRFVQTGPNSPGTQVQPAICGPSSSGSSAAQTSNVQVTLSGFDAPATITAPPDPFVLPSGPSGSSA